MPALSALLRKFVQPWTFVFGVTAAVAAANTSLFESRVWDMNAGLPHNSVMAIAQTTDGFLWIGTMQGLTRFDGVKFIPLDLGSVLTNGAPAISALCAGKDGSLWIGTKTEGIVRCKDGELRRFSKATGLLSDSIRALVTDEEGAIWIGTTRGVSRWQDETLSHYKATNGLTADSVRCLCRDRQGAIWIVSGFGPGQVHQIKDGLVNEVTISDASLRRNAARAIYVDRSGALWLGFTSGLLRHVGKGKDKFISKSGGLADDVVSAFGEDHSGNLWIGTYGGLSRWFDGKMVREFNQTGVFFDQINAIFEDREENIWLGTKTGLYRLAQTASVTYAREHGLSHNNVMSICEMRPGNFWIGTWGGGLNWMHDGQIDRFTQTIHGHVGLTSDFILGLGQEPDGQPWLGTDYGGGIFKINFKTNGPPTFSHFGSKEGFKHTIIRVVHADEKGAVWFGTQEGVAVYNGGKFTSYTINEGLGGVGVREIVEDGEGSYWIATASGISRFKDGQFNNFTPADGLSDSDVRALSVDKTAKAIWIGTATGGLNRLKKAAGEPFEFTAYTAKEGLWSDEIFNIVDDGRGFLWMSCVRGIFRVAKTEFADFDSGKIKRLNCFPFGHHDNVASIQCNGVAKPGAIRAADGRLLFATVKGVVVIDPNFNRTNRMVPPVVMEKIIADQEVFSDEGAKGRKGEKGNAPPTPLLLPPGRGELEFRFTALSLQEPEHVGFKFKLVGVDNDWREAGNRRDAHYNNIVPGTYEFRVIACNNDGVWNEKGASVKFTLQPHFWQTWWFNSFCAVALVSLVGGGARFATRRRMQIKLERLQQQHALEKERSRIARDMHDEIGARLTQISFLGSLAKRRLDNPAAAEKQIDTIAQTARDVVSALDEIVWTVDPRKDTLENLATFLGRHASKFFQDSPMSCEFDLPTELPHCHLETDVRHNVFLAVKEAMNNALKHSGATRVVLQMRVVSSELDIVISDNGHGFNPPRPASEINLPPRAGNGLGNMQHRLEAIGGKCRMESAPGKGTQVCFSFPLPKAQE